MQNLFFPFLTECLTRAKRSITSIHQVERTLKISFTPTVINFGLPMGVLGAGVNASNLENLYISTGVTAILFLLGMVSFVLIGAHYLYHLTSTHSRRQLALEWGDAFKRSFLPAITLTAFLFIIAIRHFVEVPFEVMALLIGFISVLQLLLNAYLLNGWIHNTNVKITDHKPTWFILISANFVASIAVMSHLGGVPFAYEVGMFFFSVGLFLWIAFATSILYRLMFAAPMSDRLRPSLFIFLAPPSLACVASVHLSADYLHTGQMASMSLITWLSYSFATLMFFLWLSQSRYFISSGVSMAGWSYVYPLAAYGLATQYVADITGSYMLIIFSLMILLAVLVLMMVLSRWLMYSAFDIKPPI